MSLLGYGPGGAGNVAGQGAGTGYTPGGQWFWFSQVVGIF